MAADAKGRDPENSRESDNVVNKSSNVSKLCMLGLVLSMAILSIHSDVQVTSQVKEFGNIRFNIEAKESRIEDGHHKVPPQLSSNYRLNTTNNGEIQILLPPEQILWMKNRAAYFNSFYEIPFGEDTEERLHAPADNNGPILDFVVAGFPKCGKM
jgi:hypothetical protein